MGLMGDMGGIVSGIAGGIHGVRMMGGSTGMDGIIG